jgi:hypothetical protein
MKLCTNVTKMFASTLNTVRGLVLLEEGAL